MQVEHRMNEAKRRAIVEILRRRDVFEKARQTLDRDLAYDDYGNPIRFSEYGNRNSEHGWEIDHYPTPKALGGSDNMTNLRPLHWRANAEHGAALGSILGWRGR